MSDLKRVLPAVLLALPLLGVCHLSLRADDKDPLPDAKARLKIEAQRVEKEFTDGRALAYKLVRRDDPRPVEATEKLQELLAMVRADTALDAKRRETLIVTLKWDIDNVQKIAADRRRSTRPLEGLPRMLRDDVRRGSDARSDDRRSSSRDVKSIIESRGRSVTDSRGDRGRADDRHTRVMRSVDESAVPESRAFVLPKDWAEKSRKRSAEQKLTAKETAILKALNTPIQVDFDKQPFEDVLDYLRKATGVTITVDQRAMTEVGVSYKSEISLRLRATTRTILKRMLADLGMAYVIKDEVIQITSAERAKEMTTARTYYIGDLASAVDFRLGPILSRLVMIQTVNQLITTITQTVEPRSWKVNNPDAVGTITFDPITMSLVVKQTAEIHYALRGSKW
jgi:hypothetical protein